MKTTICHFKNWIKNWDEKIKSFEGRKSQQFNSERIKKCISKIDFFLNSTDENAMRKFQTDEEKAKALIQNQEKDFYKSLTSVRNDLTALLYDFERLYEVQHRIISENFELRAK